MEIYLIRHTQVQAEGICYGHSDVPLAETFEQEALAVQQKLGFTPGRIISSPASRCVALAQKLASQPVPTDERLREYHFGDWELQPWQAIPQQALAHWKANFVHLPPPNGESLRELYQRVTGFLHEQLATPDSPLSLVTHSVVIRCFWAMALEMPLQNIFKLPVDFGSITVLSYDKKARDFKVRALK
jgi:alpha-ribazole phosphatase